MSNKINLYLDINSIIVENGEIKYQYTQEDITYILNDLASKKEGLVTAIAQFNSQIVELQSKIDLLTSELNNITNTETQFQQVLRLING